MSELWYKHWADSWNEALPIGNGKLGAMIFSNPFCDKLQVNEETLWTGSPHNKSKKADLSKLSEIRQELFSGNYDKANSEISDFMSGNQSEGYVSMGNLFVDHNDINSSDIENYRRTLNLETAVLNTVYTIDGVDYEKEYFVSFRDNCLVYRFKNTKWFEAYISFQSNLKNNISVSGNTITVEGRCPTKMVRTAWPLEIRYDEDKESIPFCAMIHVWSNNVTTDEGNCIKVSGPNDMIILMTVSTGFNGADKMPMSEGRDYKKNCRDKLEKALSLSYDELKSRHIESYGKMYSRSVLIIDGEDYSDIPTDERIKNAATGTVDCGLVTMLFDYAKYLLLSSSYDCNAPANLQGIWAKELTPPWGSGYTTNINLQMNYWCAEQVNLPECHEVLMRFIKKASKKGNRYGMNGWMLAHNSDIWCFNEEPGKSPFAFWQMGGLWLCRHIYEHYMFTGNAEFLREYFPVIDGAFEFISDWLTEDKDGYLVTAPSVSPENTFRFNGKNVTNCIGCAMDLSIIRDFLMNTAELAKILGLPTEKYDLLKMRLKPLSVGSDGRLLEWNEEFEEIEKGHRHVSHLFGIYPGRCIERNSREEAAALKSLDYRIKNGGGHTGWSNAWIACLYARLGDGENVYKYIMNMFKNSIYPNMLDAHPPFQIDGNFGICAAICEALIQSHDGKPEFLPALPEEWKNGSFRGFKIRGGYTVDASWKNGKITYLKMTDKNGRVCNSDILK